MKKLFSRFLLCLLAGVCQQAMAQTEKTPAFPGAEGFGRYVTGGRGGVVYHVTNLNNAGEGSLRWALEKSGTRTIVFDVSGTIHLTSSLNITNGNVTIAGQTAPGDGICVADYPVAIKANNVIVRYMRFRLGNKNVTLDGADGWDGFGGFDQKDWMIDHCSVSWSIDECLSVLGNKNTTVQWCLVAQSLVNSGHSKGSHGYGGNWGGSGASFHHNLIAHHTSRTPRLGPRPTTQLDERMDMRNNVIYNYGSNGCYGGEGMTVNIVNNYYKPGPGTPSGSSSRELKAKRIAGIGVRTEAYCTTYPAYRPALHLWGKYYVTGNVNWKYDDVTKDNWNIGVIQQINADDTDGTFTAKTQDTIKLEKPMDFVVTTTHTAAKAYEKVLAYVGASLHRDSFDELMISDTRYGRATYTGSGLDEGFVNSQDDNKPANAGDDWSAWPTLNSTTAPTDTDGDGMPDDWETANGLNPNDPSDGSMTAENGYTNLENYLNSLVAEITENEYKDGEQQGYVINNSTGTTTEEGKSAAGTGAITWEFGTGSAGQTAIYDEDIRTMLGANNVTIGSHLSYNNSRKISNIAFTQFRPTQKEATANDDDAISFNITAANGYYFKPTNVKFYVSRIGTDGGAIDVYWKNSQGTTELESNLSPNRNNGNPAYTSFNKDINDISSAAGTSSLIINVYSLSNEKDIALSNIIITGQVLTDASGISEVTTISTDGKTYNLQGIEVVNPTKGIYIRNGKKIVIK